MNIRTLSATAVAGVALATITVAPALATGGQTGKVTLCHVAAGKAVTLHLPVAAAHGHKHHVDDYLGACKPRPTEPTPTPEPEPTTEPTTVPTTEPTVDPTTEPTSVPTTVPTEDPTEDPTTAPTEEPTTEPTVEPTTQPTTEPTVSPTTVPTTEPTVEPTVPLEPVIPIRRSPRGWLLYPPVAIEREQAEPTARATTPAPRPVSTTDGQLANTGGADRAWGIASVLAIATGLVLAAGSRWARRDTESER